MNEHDQLSALWQAQPTTRIDGEKIKQAFFHQQRKQRLYTALDIGGLLFMAGAIIFSWDSFSALAAGMLVVIALMFLPFSGYVIWLRRHTAFASASQITSYQDNVKKQTANNVHIARLTKHSFWATFLALVIFFTTLYLIGDYSEEKLGKLVIMMAATAVVCLCGYRWADKREKRYRRESAHFEDMFSE